MDNPGLELGSRELRSRAEGKKVLDTFDDPHPDPVVYEDKRTVGGHGHDPGALVRDDLLYGIEDVPPWYMTIFLGFQHYLEMMGGTVSCPFFLVPALCMADDDPDKANIISTLVFMSGIITILQSTVGSRLPIVQGGSYSYLIPSLAILKLPKWTCPAPDIFDAMSDPEKTEVWQVRMREIQGAIIFAALFEAVFAFTGIIGLALKYLTPMAVCPAITLIGLAFFEQMAVAASSNFYVSISTLLLLIIFSQHLRNIQIPFLCGKIGADGKKEKFPIFQVFPVLLAVGTIWGICAVLTATDVLKVGDPARTDSKLKIMTESPWFRIPYPFQWGIPTVSIGAVLGLACGVMTSTIESLGDYYACASIAKTTSPPTHAMNRGIFIEGMGCVLSGIFGSGNGSTSYSNNIGTLGVTKVASRRVVQMSGIIMVVFGLVAKSGAVFISLPDPIVAGLFLFILPVCVAVALGTLAEVSMVSSRNLFIVAFAIFMGLTISKWMSSNPGVIQTGSEDVDVLIQIILSTGMFVAGFIGFLLDNTVPGTDEERGLTQRSMEKKAAALAGDHTTYDFPIGMSLIRRIKCLRWLPISPTFTVHPVTLLKSRRGASKLKLEQQQQHHNNGTINLRL